MRIDNEASNTKRAFVVQKSLHSFFSGSLYILPSRKPYILPYRKYNKEIRCKQSSCCTKKKCILFSVVVHTVCPLESHTFYPIESIIEKFGAKRALAVQKNLHSFFSGSPYILPSRKHNSVVHKFYPKAIESIIEKFGACKHRFLAVF